ncbi:hypothetical protein H6P81_010985 [Aristolochia fimbriata]|uniref:Uncharacterized protein n=1 Tax=Aristolochia fimbriata TaxID=158543 RepID=A0AAV7EQA5_ARIFI|nr:hypothetical protein H6P81_010985 [Aristolochia fimbriata]
MLLLLLLLYTTLSLSLSLSFSPFDATLKSKTRDLSRQLDDAGISMMKVQKDLLQKGVVQSSESGGGKMEPSQGKDQNPWRAFYLKVWVH